jgi:hypothetical protein
MKIKGFLNINKLSFFLLILPYLAFNWTIIYNSPFFNYSKFLALLGLILSIDLIIKKFSWANPNSQKLFDNVVIILVLLLFYGSYFSLFAQKFIFIFLGIQIKGRVIFLVMSFIIVCLIFIKGSFFMKFLNIFLINFSVINFLLSYKTVKSVNEIKSSYQHIYLEEKRSRPVILLVCDEYSSPNELYKIFKDSSVYDYSSYLKKINWIVKNSLYSNEISTIHSLSSLFNFNLSKDNKYSEINMFDIGPKKLMKAAIYDSLYRKNIELINFGIFDIGKSEPLNSLYFYPKNFSDQVLFNSGIKYIIDYTGGLKIKGFGISYNLYESQNQFILENFTDSIKSINNSRIFIYAHLMMPHSPFKFKSEFKITSTNNLLNYRNYWEFTNKKLKKLLLELTKENKYRIILSGDHGFRGDKRIDPNQTFIAFYGFDERDLISIQSVQDVGSLINACYK